MFFACDYIKNFILYIYKQKKKVRKMDYELKTDLPTIDVEELFIIDSVLCDYNDYHNNRLRTFSYNDAIRKIGENTESEE